MEINYEISFEEAAARIRRKEKILFIKHWIGPYFLCYKPYDENTMEIFKEIPSWLWIPQERGFKCHYLDLPLLEAIALHNGYITKYDIGLTEILIKIKEEYKFRWEIKKNPVMQIAFMKRQMRNYQIIGSQFMYHAQRVLNADSMGCVEGKAKINILYKGKMYTETIGKLYGFMYERFKTQRIGVKKHKFDALMDKTINSDIYTYSLKDGFLTINKILDVYKRGKKRVIRITTEDGGVIKVTPDHKMCISTKISKERIDGTFKPAGELKVGDVLIRRKNSLEVKEVKIVKIERLSAVEVYDILMMGPYHTFVANDFVVSNSGKTLQTIGAILLNKVANKPYKTLIIAPASVKSSWYKEIVESTDALKPLILDSNTEKRYEQYLSLTDEDVLIASFDSLLKDYAEIHNYFKPNIVVVDECFPGFTNIITKHGPMRIKDIYYKYKQSKILALSYNLKEKKFEYKPVTFAWERPNKPLVDVILNNNLIRCTPNHLFLTTQGYVEAAKLKPGDILIGTEQTKVLAVQRTAATIESNLYDIEVKDNHNFVVANPYGGGIVVHNCHRIANRKNKITQVLIGGTQVRKTLFDYIEPHSVYLLTGTPIMNKLEDLYSIFKMLDPGIFSWQGFQNRYLVIEEGYRTYKNGGIKRMHKYSVVAGYRNQSELKSKLSLYMIRRTKDEILPELPEKIYKILNIELSQEERKIYNDLRTQFKTIVNDKVITIATKLQFVTRAQQICNSLETLPDHPSTKSSKLEEVKELIEAEADKHKILIFSKYKTMTDIICRELKKFNPLHLHGEIDSNDRQELIDKFQNDPKYRLFVSTYGAGGVGITLTAADIVILYDMAFTPAANAQAVDRAHRLNKKNSVYVVVPIVNDSIEERIYEINMNKQGIIDTMISDERNVLARLGERDLENLI